jgi:dTDP-glucose 4,6-dehydratase
MTILVTGAAGFIGSNFVLDWFDQSPEGVVSLDLLTYAGNLENLSSLSNNPHHHFIQGNISNCKLLSKLLKKYQIRAVVNFAAESHVDRSIYGPGDFIETNIIGTYNLLESVTSYWNDLDNASKKTFRFLHISTDEVYGSLDEKASAFTEGHPYEPNSPYSASKAASDHLVRAWFHTYGLPTLTSNCSNNYGPYHFPEKLIPLVILNALEEKPLPVYGKGENIRDWLYVEDHATALATIMMQGKVGESYNVGGEAERTNLEVVETICDLLDARVPPKSVKTRRDLITFVTDRPGHDRRYAIDCSKLKAELGWTQTVDFDAGLARTIDWYLINEDWWAPLRAARYAGERLGSTPK